MTTKLYVANFTFRSTDRDLGRLFEPFGAVESAQVARDKESGRSKGFGFVEMADAAEAAAAQAALHGKQISGRALIVQEYRARDDGDRPRRPSRAAGPRAKARPAKDAPPRKKHPPALGSRLRKPRPKPGEA